MNRNLRVAAICAVVFVAMVGAAYASVPLYRIFCQATGFGGTPRRAQEAASHQLDRTVVVRFDTNIRGLPWDFAPEQASETVKIGATNLAFFKVTNNGAQPITGRAAYNVTPESTSPYFSKLECFCFKDQTIKPGETKEFPVAYFVDPLIAQDADAGRVQEITLSYTFYRSPDQKPSA